MSFVFQEQKEEGADLSSILIVPTANATTEGLHEKEEREDGGEDEGDGGKKAAKPKAKPKPKAKVFLLSFHFLLS